MNQATKMEFGSLEELLSEIEQYPIGIEGLDYFPSTQDDCPHHLKWAGGTYREAIRLARSGWKEGLAMVKAREASIGATGMGGNDLTREMDFAGDEVDVGLMLEGDPESMINWTMAPSLKPVVKIVVSVAASANVSKDTIAARGAAIMAAIDATESIGVRCEVWMDHTVTPDFAWDPKEFKNRRLFVHRVMMKASDQPLDREAMAFALINPMFLRRIMFRLHEKDLRTFNQRGGNGYGYPASSEGIDTDDCIFIGPMQGFGELDWSNTESVHKFIDGIISKITK